MHDGAHRRPCRATRRSRSVGTPGALAATSSVTTRFIGTTASTLRHISSPTPCRTPSAPARRTAPALDSPPLAATAYCLNPLIDALPRPPKDFPTTFETPKGTLAGVLRAFPRSSAGSFHVPWNALATSGGSTRGPLVVGTSQTSRGATAPPRCSLPALSAVPPLLDCTVAVGFCLRVSQQHQPRRGLHQSPFPHTLVEWRQIRRCGWLFSLLFLGRRCRQSSQPLRFQPRLLYGSQLESHGKNRYRHRLNLGSRMNIDGGKGVVRIEFS